MAQSPTPGLTTRFEGDVPLRFTLAAKITFAFAGTALVAVAGSVVPLVLMTRTREKMETGVAENVDQIRAVTELEITLLGQGSLIHAFVQSGEKKWLDELARLRPEFGKRVAVVKRHIATDREREIVDQIVAAFREYDEGRTEVIRTYNAGLKEEARQQLLGPVNDLYEKTHLLCDELVRFDYNHMDAALADWRTSLQHASVTVAVAASLTILFSGALLAYLYGGVLRPLRQIAADARERAGAADAPCGAPAEDDDVRAVGFYLETLRSDAVDARESLEKSRTRLANAEKLASVGKLAASVAHEIRNPLTSIKMQLYVVSLAFEDNPQFEGNLKILTDEVNRLDEVIRSFLEFARPPELKIAAFDVGQLFEQTVSLVRHKLKARNIAFTSEVEPGMPKARGDVNQVKQVLVNLINNAEEVLGEGGTIALTASSETSYRDDSMIVIRVKDDGPGIPPDVRARLFEPFFSTKDDGTGLGLCIAGRIMARHNGKLDLESTTEQGSVFAAWLPVDVG
jgi:signal transduction histidine kinase